MCLLLKLLLTLGDWKFLTEKWSNFYGKSVINSEVMFLYLDSVVRITSYVQTLILDLVSTYHLIHVIAYVAYLLFAV